MIDETLEIGTRESAVEAFVNLMSAALNMPEKKLHYWLDCYYQLRLEYEIEIHTSRKKEPLNENRSENIKDAENGAEDFDDGQAAEPAITERYAPGTGGHWASNPNTGSPINFDSVFITAEALTEEPIKLIDMYGNVVAAGRPPIGLEAPGEGEPEKAKKSIKQETHARLMAAREKGVTIAQLHTASGKKLTEGDICGMLNSMPLPEAKWKIMKKALDKIESKEGEK